MSFDRAAWLDATLAGARADPDPPVNVKEVVTFLALLADGDGLVTVAEFEQVTGVAPGALRPKWGEVIRLALPCGSGPPGNLEEADS